MKCFIASGLPKEVEEQINAFLTQEQVRVAHVTQSESHDNMKVTILYTPLDAGLESGGGRAEAHAETRARR